MKKNNSFLVDINNLISDIKKIHPLKDKFSKKWYYTAKKKVKKLAQVKGFNHFYFLLHYILYGFQDGHIQSSLTHQYEKLSTPKWAGILAQYDHRNKVLLVYQSIHPDIPEGSKITQINGTKARIYINQIIYSFGGVTNVPYYQQKNAIFCFLYFEHQNHPLADMISIKNKSLGKIVNISLKERYQNCNDYQDIIYRHLRKITYRLDLHKKFKFHSKVRKRTLYCQIPTFIFSGKKDSNQYQKLIDLLATQKEKYRKIILDIRNNPGGDINTMALLTYTLFQIPTPNFITTYQKISPIISKNWEEQVINKHVIPSFGKKSKVYQNEIKNLAMQKKFYDKGISLLVTQNKMFHSIPKKIKQGENLKPYLGKVEILINEFCGSACLLLLDYLSAFTNVKICGSTTNVDTSNFNALTFQLPKTKTQYTMVTTYRERKREYNIYYDGNDEKVKII